MDAAPSCRDAACCVSITTNECRLPRLHIVGGVDAVFITDPFIRDAAGSVSTSMDATNKPATRFRRDNIASLHSSGKICPVPLAGRWGRQLHSSTNLSLQSNSIRLNIARLPRGMIMRCNALHPLNAFHPIFVTPFGMVKTTLDEKHTMSLVISAS